MTVNDKIDPNREIERLALLDHSGKSLPDTEIIKLRLQLTPKCKL